MKILLFHIILLTALGLAACGDQPSGRTASDQGQPAAASPAPAPATNKSVAKIVAFGDSLTAGYGLPPAESYPALLQERLKADGFQYEVVNAGVSGDTSAGGLRRVDWALEGDVRFMILELGANDILRGQPIPAMKQNLSRIIERLKSRGVIVLLAGIEAPTNAGAEYRKEARDAFQELSKEHGVPMVPFLLDRIAGVETLNQGDGIHPNREGTRIMADNVYKYLRPLLEKEQS